MICVIICAYTVSPKKIEKIGAQLTQYILTSEELLLKLQEFGVLTKEDCDSVTSSSDEYDRCDALFKCLKEKDDNKQLTDKMCHDFLNALKLTNQTHVVNLIRWSEG